MENDFPKIPRNLLPNKHDHFPMVSKSLYSTQQYKCGHFYQLLWAQQLVTVTSFHNTLYKDHVVTSFHNTLYKDHVVGFGFNHVNFDLYRPQSP